MVKGKGCMSHERNCPAIRCKIILYKPVFRQSIAFPGNLVAPPPKTRRQSIKRYGIIDHIHGQFEKALKNE
jgi:hypothetical protein